MANNSSRRRIANTGPPAGRRPAGRNNQGKRSYGFISQVVLGVILCFLGIIYGTRLYTKRQYEIIAKQYEGDLGDMNSEGFAMIIPARDEEEFLAKTLLHFAEMLPGIPNHINEICVYDDASKEPIANWLLDAIPKELAAKVQIVRSEKPMGLMEGRVRCAEMVTSKFLLFMDGHCRPMNPEWSLALLKSLKDHRNRFAVPRIVDIGRRTWEPRSQWNNTDVGGSKMMFDWTMEFYWQQALTDEIPIMVGGIYAVDREYFFEIGAYDRGMREWGGENIEQSIRVWSCGGEIIAVNDSVVGHIFDRDAKPNPGNKLVERIQKNHLRVARVWLDEHLKLFTKHHHSARHFLEDLERRPNSSENKNLVERNEFKETRQCHPFDWFLNRFRSSFDRHGLIENDYHGLVVVPNTYEGVYPIDLANVHGSYTWSPYGSSERRVEGRAAIVDRVDIPKEELIYHSLHNGSSNKKHLGHCLQADRDKMRVTLGYCKPERDVTMGTFNDMWINEMGRRVLRVRNLIAPQGKVFDVSSLCVAPPIGGIIGKKRVAVRLASCSDLENNAIMKNSSNDKGSIFVDVPRRHTEPFYNVYDQRGYDEGDTGRIIWLPTSAKTLDGNDDIDRSIIIDQCFSGTDHCACIGTKDGFHLEWVNCVAQKEETLKITWIM